MPSAATGFVVIGHRGARGHAPENTLASMRKALELGAPWIEIDVHLHEGELLVLHDARLERTTSGRGRVCDHPLAALRALDAGGGERIPILSEVLACIGGRAGLNVEMKSGAGTAAAVARQLDGALQQHWRRDQLLVSSFNLPELREFRRLRPDIPVGVLFAGVPLDLAAAGSELAAAVVSLSKEFAEPALIDDAHRRGLQVYVYTVNEPDELHRLRALGVDGVFSDYPDRMLQSLREAGRPAAGRV